jgi:hypothetical protein
MDTSEKTIGELLAEPKSNKKILFTARNTTHPILFFVGLAVFCWGIYKFYLILSFTSDKYVGGLTFVIVMYSTIIGGGLAFLCLFEAFIPRKALELSETGFLVYQWIIKPGSKYSLYAPLTKFFVVYSQKYFFPWKAIKDIQFFPDFMDFSITILLNQKVQYLDKKSPEVEEKIHIQIEKLNKDPHYIFNEMNSYWVKNKSIPQN